jgi:hypothetical protein
MSENTTEETKSNIVQLPTQDNQPPASDVSETPAAEPTAEETTGEADHIQKVIENVDLNTITRDDIFVDLINKSKLFAFNLLIAAALLEKLIIKDRSEAEQTTPESAPEDQAVS